MQIIMVNHYYLHFVLPSFAQTLTTTAWKNRTASGVACWPLRKHRSKPLSEVRGLFSSVSFFLLYSLLSSAHGVAVAAFQLMWPLNPVPIPQTRSIPVLPTTLYLLLK